MNWMYIPCALAVEIRTDGKTKLQDDIETESQRDDKGEPPFHLVYQLDPDTWYSREVGEDFNLLRHPAANTLAWVTRHPDWFSTDRAAWAHAGKEIRLERMSDKTIEVI
jgi:hypothetical protein